MGRLRAILIALVMGLAATVALASCGGEEADLLPGETASEINANLDLVEQLVAEGDCTGAENAAAAVKEQVEGLEGVDPELVQALNDGAARLNEVIVECDEEPAEEEETLPSVDPEEEELEGEAEEKEQQKAEKEAEKEQKKEEKAEKEAPPEETTEPPGQEKKEEVEAPPVEPPSGGTPSGGVGPSTPAEAE